MDHTVRSLSFWINSPCCLFCPSCRKHEGKRVLIWSTSASFLTVTALPSVISRSPSPSFTTRVSRFEADSTPCPGSPSPFDSSLTRSLLAFLPSGPWLPATVLWGARLLSGWLPTTCSRATGSQSQGRLRCPRNGTPSTSYVVHQGHRHAFFPAAVILVSSVLVSLKMSPPCPIKSERKSKSKQEAGLLSLFSEDQAGWWFTLFSIVLG